MKRAHHFTSIARSSYRRAHINWVDPTVRVFAVMNSIISWSSGTSLANIESSFYYTPISEAVESKSK